MTLLVLSYFAGILTLLSPCVLPVLPFVFSRAGQPFVRSVLPLLLGMTITFASLAALAAVGGAWVVRANGYGRIVAMVLLACVGVMLIWPALAERLLQPLAAAGNRLFQVGEPSSNDGVGRTAAASFAIGVGTGFLWAPCAGPILGLILTGAALKGPSARTVLLLTSYAAGAATSLALAVFAGGRAFQALKRTSRAGEWIRRALGVAVLASVALVASGLDATVLTRWSVANTSRMEQALIDTLGPAKPARTMSAMAASAAGAFRAAGASRSDTLPEEGDFPGLNGATAWINSAPLTAQGLRGKVVLVDFWTYSCINCLRSLPYVRAWNQKYRDHGLVVIGVHTPEFAFEHNLDNVREAVKRLHIDYPVAVDNQYAIWGAFSNEYWPADYFIDSSGHIRGHQFGEGDYESAERLIQQLLMRAGYRGVPGGYVAVDGRGAEAPSDVNDVRSGETYIGYAQSQNFESPGGTVKGQPTAYRLPTRLDLNGWGLSGVWRVEGEKAVLVRAPGQITFKFHARDLHLVLGPAPGGAPVRFRVLLDGVAPGADHGVDIDAAGNGVVREQRLYQLIRQSHGVQDRTFTVEFLDPGVQAFSFTFG